MYTFYRNCIPVFALPKNNSCDAVEQSLGLNYNLFADTSNPLLSTLLKLTNCVTVPVSLGL